jgi:hypothetical protein
MPIAIAFREHVWPGEGKLPVMHRPRLRLAEPIVRFLIAIVNDLAAQRFLVAGLILARGGVWVLGAPPKRLGNSAVSVGERWAY